jgi:hypothetical protein
MPAEPRCDFLGEPYLRTRRGPLGLGRARRGARQRIEYGDAGWSVGVVRRCEHDQDVEVFGDVHEPVFFAVVHGDDASLTDLVLPSLHFERAAAAQYHVHLVGSVRMLAVGAVGGQYVDAQRHSAAAQELVIWLRLLGEPVQFIQVERLESWCASW